MKKTVFFIVIAALVLAGCGAMAQRSVVEEPLMAPQYYGQGGGVAPEQEYYAPDMALPAATMMPSQPESGGGNLAAPVERIVIQNADLAVVVPDVQKRAQELEAMAKEMGGFLVSSQQYQTYTNNGIQVPEVALTIRIPSERLDEALALVKKDAIEVRNENRTGTDVTAEYVDLQSRLKNLKAAESQLQEILETAEKTEDVINVFNQLVYYREQIELVQGQINYYDEAARLSAINVRLISEETVEPIQIPGWKPGSVASQAFQDLKIFLQDFANFLIAFFVRDLWEILITLSPFAILFFIGRAIFRRVRANRAR
ncbi:MAG: DUF4349 domain-containing protein [Chloroflexota bacterium]